MPTQAGAMPGDADLGIVDSLAQLSFAVHALLGRIAAANELSIVQARLLGILRDRQPTITELAGFLQLDKSSVTGLVDRAADRGLVQRAASPLDGRSVQVSLTGAGRELVERTSKAFRSETEKLVGHLRANQQKQLSSLASSVVAADAQRRGVDLFAAPARARR